MVCAINIRNLHTYVDNSIQGIVWEYFKVSIKDGVIPILHHT